MSQTESSSKTSSIKMMLSKAARENWTDMQWGIEIKKVLPRGCSGDAYNLSELILRQALSTSTPNELIIGFLRYTLASQIVSHHGLLTSISKFGDEENLANPKCIAELLSILESAQEHITSRGRPEDCMQLSIALIQVVHWLVKVILYTYEIVEKISTGNQDKAILISNACKAINIASYLTETDFTLGMLYLGRSEDRECHGKIVASCKHLNELARQSQLLSADDPTSVKQSVNKLTSVLKNLDSSRCVMALDNAHLTNYFSSTNLSLQPILAFEAMTRTNSDMTALSQHIFALASTKSVGFSEMVYQLLLACLSGITQSMDVNDLKWDAFVLIKLPSLLDKLASLMRLDPSQLKTPTDLYKAFDKLLKNNEALLDSIDAKGKNSQGAGNIIKILLSVVAKTSFPLMTETEAIDVEKRRKPVWTKINKMLTEQIPRDSLSDGKSVDISLKAETTMDSVLKKLEVDSSKSETMDSLVSVLCQIIDCDSLDILLASAAANGKLKQFVKHIVKHNQQSQESQGESVKNSMLRAALFDITFLMLIHIAQTFGKEVVVDEAKDTLIEMWIRDLLFQDQGRYKTTPLLSTVENPIVDNLLQQLSGGELRTQVVKWKNICANIHLAFKEMVVALQSGTLAKGTYIKMAQTVCSRLCSLPVCIASWMFNFKASVPGSTYQMREKIDEFYEIAFRSDLHNDEMPHAKERLKIMKMILDKMKQAAFSDPIVRIDPESRTSSNVALDVSLTKIWERTMALQKLDFETTWHFHDLYKLGGPVWFVSSIVNKVLSEVYQDDLEKASELATSIFHVDVEQCCLALLMHVVPSFIQNKNGMEYLTDPHGSILAAMTVTLTYSVLIARQVAAKDALKPRDGIGQKRPLSDEDDIKDLPTPKFRRLLTGVAAAGGDDVINSGFRDSPDIGGSSFNTVTAALGGFLDLLHRSSQSNSVMPVTHFAVRFLEQAAFRKGRGSTTKSRLILQHISQHFVMHLIKIVPEMFSIAFLTQLLDSGSSSGRKNMARVMCLLRNVKKKRSHSQLPHPTTSTLVQARG